MAWPDGGRVSVQQEQVGSLGRTGDESAADEGGAVGDGETRPFSQVRDMLVAPNRLIERAVSSFVGTGNSQPTARCSLTEHKEVVPGISSGVVLPQPLTRRPCGYCRRGMAG
jgi:hypothetical protein